MARGMASDTAVEPVAAGNNAGTAATASWGNLDDANAPPIKHKHEGSALAVIESRLEAIAARNETTGDTDEPSKTSQS